MLFLEILETQTTVNYLESRNLIKAYQKVKKFLLSGNYLQVNFKIRQPKVAKIYYFRINKKYRALAIIKNKSLIVFEIDDHQ